MHIDDGNVRRGLTIGYDEFELTYTPWAKDLGWTLAESGHVYYANPFLFDCLDSVLQRVVHQEPIVLSPSKPLAVLMVSGAYGEPS